MFELRDYLLAGLRHSANLPRNTAAAVELKNLIPRPEGLAAYLPVKDPLLAGELAAKGITIAYPYPFFAKLNRKMLLLDPDAVYEVDTKPATDAASGWTLSTGVLTGDTISTTDDHPWHIADLNAAVWLFNGPSVVYNDYTRDAAGNTVTDYVVTNSRTVNTGTAHRGRIFMGGFDVSDFWSTAWKDEIKDRITQAPSAMEVFSDLDTGWVWWSSIGGGDVRFLWDLTLAISGHPDIDNAHDAAWPIWLDFIQRNEAGFMPIPTIGAVRQMKPLGHGVMVYAHDAVGFLRPVSDPVPTMSWTPLLDHGGGRIAQVAAGDESEHVFLTQGGSFYRIRAKDLALEYIGGEEVGTTLVGLSNNITAHFDSFRREAYFMDGDGSDVIIIGPSNQITVVDFEIPTSVVRVSRAGTAADGPPIIGIKDTPSGGANLGAVFETEIFDMGSRQVKTIHRIEMDGATGMKIDLKVRYTASGAFSSHTLTFDSDGIAIAELSGVDFAIRITDIDFLTARIDNLSVEFDKSRRVDIEALVNV